MREGRKVLVPFLTAGDPDLEFTVAAVQRLVQCGCGPVEIGFPYSDPIADGPVIQASYTRALRAAGGLASILAMADRLRRSIDVPLVAMVSYSIVFRNGPAAFLEQACRHGFSGFIIPDLPLEESRETETLAAGLDASLIRLVTPTTPRERAARIAERSTGFLYYVSIAGTTGERDQMAESLWESIAWLKQRAALPVCVGFGVSRPDQVRRIAEVADGVIVGSALVRRIERAADPRARKSVLDDLAGFARSLVAELFPPAQPRRR
jgi:tryptophan synthase alpha chain